MLKQLLVTTAVTGLLIGGALAQETKSPPAMSTPPAAAAPSEMKFINAQGADQWVFSKFKGTDVLGPNDEHIGDVSDLLFDKAGKIHGVVVGVGGFLGIGEKNVAIDMNAFQVVPASANSTAGAPPKDPTNVKLKVTWTKEQLKGAPDFKYYSASATTGMGNSNNRSSTPPKSR